MGFTADVDVCTGWMNVFGEWVLPPGLSFLYLRRRLAGRLYGALAGWKVRPDQLRPAHRNEVIAALSLLVCCLTSSRYRVHVLSSSIAHMLECGVSANLRRNASLPPVPIGFVSPLMTSISRPCLVCWRRILPLSAASEAPRLQTTCCDAILGAIPSVTYRQYIAMTTKKDPSALDPLYENDRRSAQCNRDPSLACSDLAA